MSQLAFPTLEGQSSLLTKRIYDIFTQELTLRGVSSMIECHHFARVNEVGDGRRGVAGVNFERQPRVPHNRHPETQHDTRVPIPGPNSRSRLGGSATGLACALCISCTIPASSIRERRVFRRNNPQTCENCGGSIFCMGFVGALFLLPCLHSLCKSSFV